MIVVQSMQWSRYPEGLCELSNTFQNPFIIRASRAV